MASTYEPIATTTLGANTSSYTFTSIPTTYTDLVLVVSTKGTGAGDYVKIRVGNGSVDTGTNYSFTDYYAASNSGSVGSGGSANLDFMYGNGFGGMMNSSNAGPASFKLNLMNYASSVNPKQVLVEAFCGPRNGGADAAVSEMMGQSWRSTSAINTIQVFTGSYLMAAGATMSLYGIKAA
jgi:hypothetical protein